MTRETLAPDPRPLTPAIGIVPAVGMVVGIILGASIFVQPSAITAHVPSALGVLSAWLAAGLLTLVGALVAAELASAFPRSGGVYVFLSEAWGPGLGFLWGWAMFWSMHSGILAAIAMVFARYVSFFVPLGTAGLRAVAIAAVLALSAVNYLGVREGSRVQTTLTAFKVLAIVGIVAVTFGLGPRVAVPAAAAMAPVSASSFILAVGAGVFAFGGWHMVTYASDETVFPERTIPRALVIGVLIVTACYIGMNAAYLHVLPIPAVIASRGVVADAANAVLGSGGATLAAAIVVVSTLGALNGIILAGPRVYYAMAQDGLIFKWMGGVHPRFRTPNRAIALQALWTSALIATGTYETLVSRVVYTEWIFFALMALALIPLHRRSGYAPRFRVPGSPVTPLLFAAAALAIAIGQIAAAPRESAIGLLLVAVGIPVYIIRSRRQISSP
ncbi:MAG TPA: amino acid permease [Gemmatimonadales bacterium]|jgi:APA family basic amino acid/polyamine antiporter